jgi:hypothetical protein
VPYGIYDIAANAQQIWSELAMKWRIGEAGHVLRKSLAFQSTK